MTPLEKLQRRWLKKTGESMPEAIARLPIGRVLTAVELTEDGQTVFVPGFGPANELDSVSSMREWDNDSFY
jgi:hypothetical protein